MCALCGILSEGPHWTEVGTDAGHSDFKASARARHLERASRVKLINRVLRHYECEADDWSGNSYVVRSRHGHMEVVDNLPQLWLAVEGIARKPADPLDPDLIATLKKGRPVGHG